VGNTLVQVNVMQMLKVNGFMGTPSFLMTLAQRAEGMGMDLKKDLYLETALVSAEMLSESLRSRIQSKLETAVRQVYGTVFLGCIGYECEHLGGLHVPDNTLVEVVDPQTGKQVEQGAAGEIVVTTFNMSYPMIRMATGDLSMLSREPCPCGRTGLMLKKILGRIDQASKVRGTFIHPWQADEVISRHPEVFKYQVVITRENHKDVMTFVVELKEEIPRPEVLQGRIERDIKEFLTVKGVVQISTKKLKTEGPGTNKTSPQRRQPSLKLWRGKRRTQRKNNFSFSAEKAASALHARHCLQPKQTGRMLFFVCQVMP
jgi:phenylacetate-CoA ligase